jgi:DNA-binding LacI/PurR family transcriptional regulator
VVNGFEKVSDETRSRILAVISQSNYRPNPHAIELVRERRENSKSRAPSVVPEIDGEVRRTLRPRRSRTEIQNKQMDLLKQENAELRNLVANLYERIAKWHCESQGRRALKV